MINWIALTTKNRSNICHFMLNHCFILNVFPNEQFCLCQFYRWKNWLVSHRNNITFVNTTLDFVVITFNIIDHYLAVSINIDQYLYKSPSISINIKQYRYQSLSILTLSWRRSLSYRNQSIYLLFKSVDWFL